MTATTFSGGTGEPLAVGVARNSAEAASRRWRSVWRIHFYAGMFAMPFILFMAATGLVILYEQPIRDLTQGNVRTITDQGDWLSFDRQEQAVERAFPDQPVRAMTVPPDGTHTTIFEIDDGSEKGRLVFVDPYTGEVIGSRGTDADVTRLAHRLHGDLNNDSVTISLPTVSALWDGDQVMRSYVVGDLVLEILGAWTIVLILSGLYLWWPRRPRSGSDAKIGRRLFSIRWSKGGRARWRDLHGLSGVLLFSVMLVTIISGLSWSTYWGPNFTALATTITPNAWTDAPPSALGERGDLDRFGNRIPWNTGDAPIPASYATKANGSLPAAMSLDTVTTIAGREGMKPGYTVAFPENAEDDDGTLVYGSFALSNSWPRKTGEARTVFLDQFSGTTLGEMSVYGYGTVSRGVDTLVSVHMGTEIGLVNRIFMTALCVLSITSVVSALVMFSKRRRKRSLGLPRRPVDVRLAKGVAALAGATAIVFPLWGVTAALVLAIDRFVIRKTRPLRVAFGQP